MADEIELKLVLDARAATALKTADLLPADSRTATLRALYFDTADHRLAQAGLSLRIRRSGRTRIQTVKADGGQAAGLFARTEWERTVKTDVPVIDDATPIPALLGGDMTAVAPLFAVEVTRTTWDIVDGDTRIELVLDQGRVIAGARKASLCEIELELIAGAPAALFRFARRIAERVPVRLGVMSKSERGYRLAGPEVRSVKAGPLLLAEDLTAGAAFQRIATAGLRHYRLNETILLETGGVEALHQARVALRRVRSALRIFGAVVRDATGVALGRDLRWLTAELGAVRDLDVLLARVRPGALHDRLTAARAEARLRPARDHAVDVLDRFRRKVKRGGRDLADTDDETRHRVRKDAKALRYASEFFATLFPEKRARRRHARFVAALEEVQDALGTLNDRAAVPVLLKTLGLEEDGEASALLASKGRKRALRTAAGAWETLVDAKRFWR